jgi:hypothetical protein
MTAASHHLLLCSRITLRRSLFRTANTYLQPTNL